MQKNKKELLNDSEKNEVNYLKSVLTDHLQKYNAFKNFTKTTADALKIADALLTNDLKAFRRYVLKYSSHTAEKMKGMQSLSTYKKTSFICKCLSNEKTGICSKCYAEKSISLYKSTLTPALIYNTLLLKYIDIDAMQIPFINDKYFRFEAFSDLQGSKHFSNLLKVCKKNKNTLFTLWTKAGYMLTDMIKKEGIKRLPNNLNIVISEYHINAKPDAEYICQLQTCLYPMQAVTGKYTNALKCFIVYDSEQKQKESNLFQCQNSCANCLKCYKKSKKNIFIAEKIH